MNILICINKAFVRPAICTLYSFCANNKGRHKAYIMHNDLTEAEFSYIRSFFPPHSIEIIDVNMETYDSKLKSGAGYDERWPITVFYRLFAPFVLPEMDRLLYLDSDIIVAGNLDSLYEVRLDDYYIAAAEDSVANDFEDLSYLHLPLNQRYMNSGLILFNMRRIRKDMSISDITSLIRNDKMLLKYPDQDIMNILFVGKIYSLDFRTFNYICSWRRYSKRQERYYSKTALIYHFGGEKFHKPWNVSYVGRYQNVFWKYASVSAYADRKYIKAIITLAKPLNRIRYLLYIDYIKLRGKLRRG